MSPHKPTGGVHCLVWLLLLTTGVPVFAENPATTDASELTHKYIGSYDTDALLTEPLVRPQLVSLLGDDLEHFLENLDVRGRIDMVSGFISLPGNAIHGGGIEEAVLCLSSINGKASAAIFSMGRIKIYSRNPVYTAHSICIKDWITQVNSGHRDRLIQPENVTFASDY